ncbi:hypothetical protein M413DRAFT_351135 [Hebeloma cylindrosporum]|uniref:Uncharacterized protein n=1 Tax=Hebeloma cylindrosporum TaxID=76867 RepID=A0A0C2XBD6_HEBCY|nr:hypothetical protein M413DRAFT_351135 [Hebeloma cylindrosporum h7]
MEISSADSESLHFTQERACDPHSNASSPLLLVVLSNAEERKDVNGLRVVLEGSLGAFSAVSREFCTSSWTSRVEDVGYLSYSRN